MLSNAGFSPLFVLEQLKKSNCSPDYSKVFPDRFSMWFTDSAKFG